MSKFQLYPFRHGSISNNLEEEHCNAVSSRATATPGLVIPDGYQELLDGWKGSALRALRNWDQINKQMPEIISTE